MIREIILAVIAFILVALVLAAIASRNKLIPPAVNAAGSNEVKSLEAHNTHSLAWLSGLWKHITDWLEVYWWLPCSVIAVCASAKLVLLLTGRETVEDANALVGFAMRLPAVVCALIAATVTRQQTAHWLTIEEAKAYLPLATVLHIKDVLIFALVLYFFLH